MFGGVCFVIIALWSIAEGNYLAGVSWVVSAHLLISIEEHNKWK